MEIDDLRKRIDDNQNWLLKTSENIKKIFAGEKKLKSIVHFITHIIETKDDILDAFDIQSETKICDALMVLLSQDSIYNEPLQKMLIYRVLTYAHSASDLKNYLEESEILKQINENLQPLINLTKRYSEEYLAGLTVDGVSKSLKNNGLADYIVHFKETDIQIVLKAIRSDKKRRENVDNLEELLSFLYSRLHANLTRQCIAASRHAWWAYKDIISYKSEEWMFENKDTVLKILNSLIDRETYTPDRKQLPASGILDTTSTYYERVWVVENAIQILIKMRELKNIFDDEYVGGLRKFIIGQIDLHMASEARAVHLRNVQCDLVLLYYVLKNYDLIYGDQEELPHALVQTEGNNLNLSPDRILKALKKRK